MRWTVATLGIVLLVVTAVVLGQQPLLGAAQDASPEATPALRFTDTETVDGRQIGLSCVGSGSPTVILIGGMTVPAEEVWPATVDAVEPLTRVCVFDRAGIGPSDPASATPQTAVDIVSDLHAALTAAGEQGPFIPVGFSFGGLSARLYASTYPEQVAGLILVEGAPPGWNVLDLTIAHLASESEQEELRDQVAGRTPPAPTSPVDMLVSETQVLAAPPSLVPAIVIVAGRAELTPSGDGDSNWGELEGSARYFELQAAQARDLDARVVIAEESGHFVPFDQPDLVIAVITDAVNTVRNAE